MADNTNGRKWARAFLVLALLISIFGNVADTCLTETKVHILLRLPGAILWPVFVFGAIEILVRIDWERGWKHIVSRGLLISPAVPAAIVSYSHLHDFLLRSGEIGAVQLMGPLAVDGLMVGCTVALLVTRPHLPSSREDSPSQAVREGGGFSLIPREEGVRILPPEELPLPREQEETVRILPPEESLPARETPPSLPAVRKGRATSWSHDKVVRMILESAPQADVVREAGFSPATYYRVREGVQLLRENPAAAVPPRLKLRADLVQLIREEVQRAA